MDVVEAALIRYFEGSAASRLRNQEERALRSTRLQDAHLNSNLANLTMRPAARPGQPLPLPGLRARGPAAKRHLLSCYIARRRRHGRAAAVAGAGQGRKKIKAPEAGACAARRPCQCYIVCRNYQIPQVAIWKYSHGRTILGGTPYRDTLEPAPMTSDLCPDSIADDYPDPSPDELGVGALFAEAPEPFHDLLAPPVDHDDLLPLTPQRTASAANLDRDRGRRQVPLVRPWWPASPRFPTSATPVGRHPAPACSFDLEATTEKRLDLFRHQPPARGASTPRATPAGGFFSLKLTVPILVGAEAKRDQPHHRTRGCRSPPR